MSHAEALLLVHLSSLDSYTATIGHAAGNALAERLAGEIGATTGFVVVLDQHWDKNEYSAPRRLVERALNAHSRVLALHHDEADHSWPETTQTLTALLRSRGISQVEVSGIWASTTTPEGAVNETRAALEQQGFACLWRPELCGLLEEIR